MKTKRLISVAARRLKFYKTAAARSSKQNIKESIFSNWKFERRITPASPQVGC